ncbi:hypothetical protein [Cupriavidus taiwanensis]|uniref:hypothetical protein n=1 Tax=Cupriavidus taiwanensis TaxID=164546 RepID=UPI0011C1BC1C|nr:hypothetical protein [Cupriavidus taiwanensis]
MTSAAVARAAGCRRADGGGREKLGNGDYIARRHAGGAGRAGGAVRRIGWLQILLIAQFQVSLPAHPQGMASTASSLR